jgi:thymidylate synthase
MLWRVKTSGVKVDTRNGPALKIDAPVCVTYTRPQERVLFNPMRDANPFFHFMEALWMLGGRDDVAFLTTFLPRMKEYSDDGATLAGAYGYRWRQHWEFDQLAYVSRLLQEDPTTRRAVLTMWDPQVDLTLEEGRKDRPCNLNAMFQINNGNLDMMVTNRSNDIIWGMCGANAVHFAFLQEYIARRIGVPVGMYHQVSFNAHVYLNEQYEKLSFVPYSDDRYLTNNMRALPMLCTTDEFDEDLQKFLERPEDTADFTTSYFTDYVCRIWDAWWLHKEGDKEAALKCIGAIPGCDWSIACYEWLERRCLK